MPQQKLNRVLANREYADLCDRVEAIDADAAKYMRSKKCSMVSVRYVDRGLRSCFRWSKTPQGFEYWYGIAIKLGERQY